MIELNLEEMNLLINLGNNFLFLFKTTKLFNPSININLWKD